MRKSLVCIAFIAIAILALPLAANAEGAKPLQLSLFNPVQLVPEDEAVEGVRLNLFYTSNTDVISLDLGLGLNRVTGTYKGVQFALVNWDEQDATALQVGLVNYIGGKGVGVQYGTVNVVEGDFSGVQWGFVNWVENSMRGFQYGCLNVSRGESIGMDLGLVNFNDGSFQGLMLGLVNYTKSLNGLQIGLINYNGNQDPFEYMVLVNWSF